MKKFLTVLALVGSTSSFAGLSEMMNIYNNPTIAPKYTACQSNLYCNGFTALSKQWDTIPKSYRYKGEYDIRKMAEIGDASSLYRGFSFGEEESTFYFIEAGADTYYQYDNKDKSDLTFARGIAVLLYMVDKNGW